MDATWSLALFLSGEAKRMMDDSGVSSITDNFVGALHTYLGVLCLMDI